MSHPVRVRGLKREFQRRAPPETMSHPVRVRGLKLNIYHFRVWGDLVAPRAGAWIETEFHFCKRFHITSHPVRVRGLKQIHRIYYEMSMRRTPCGCVD